MKNDDIGEEKFVCAVCGIAIKASTALENDGLCTPCRKKKDKDAAAGRAAPDVPGAD